MNKTSNTTKILDLINTLRRLLESEYMELSKRLDKEVEKLEKEGKIPWNSIVESLKHHVATIRVILEETWTLGDYMGVQSDMI